MLPELSTEISEDVENEAQGIADVLGENVWTDFPTLDGVEPQTPGLSEIILSGNWRPSLSVTGVDGMPSLKDAGKFMCIIYKAGFSATQTLHIRTCI